MGNEELPVPRHFSYDCDHKKAAVPCVHDKPVQGLRTSKNFIVSNAIENILSVAKRPPEEVDWTQKREYGQTPTYIQKIKKNIDDEYKMMRNLHEENQVHKDCLSEEEVNTLREGLKRKWDEVNREYQKMTHVRVVDTLGSKNRKEGYEKELSQI